MLERSTTALLVAFAAIAVGGLVVALQPPEPAPPAPEAPAAPAPAPAPPAPGPSARIEAAPPACGLTLPPGSKLAALTVRPGDALAVGQVFARLADGREVRSPRAGKVTLIGLKVGETAPPDGAHPARPAVVLDPTAAWVARLALPSVAGAPPPTVRLGDAIPLRAASGDLVGVVVEVRPQPGGTEVLLDLPAAADVKPGEPLHPPSPLPASPEPAGAPPLFAGVVVATPSLATRRLSPALSAQPSLRPPPRDGFHLDDGATTGPRLGAGPPGGAPPPGGFRLKPATRPLLTPPPRTEPP